MSRIADVLRRIVARRREAVAAAGETAGELPERTTPLTAEGNPFLAALEARRGRAVIAEVKMGSPRIGSLAGRIDPEAQARLYAREGAAALSVVVEPDFFGGSYDLLARCREASELPAIAKDFVVDPVQLRWARDAGASAVLLIAALYGAEELRRLAARARGLGLAPLVETHDLSDLRKLTPRSDGDEGPRRDDPRAGTGADAPPDWELVGVNHRDLRTFRVDLEHSRELLPRLPEGALRVAESGIRTAGDCRALRRAGFDAFLVGESLLLADDPAATLRELLS